MEYRVLARKYRPTNFDDLIGQEVLVRTLSNAISSGRIAHAFLLTGIRGVGKTTTARIIARALNCEQGPTINPCGVCSQCRMIGEGRHMDVLEMDAASHTGVGDIRDLIDTVRYLPTSARYKIYIIDEVHMLSTNAFNALLKTLEEPPAHVKFVFATTEVRKIPVTILSRCQRFDLKRVGVEMLAAHLSRIIAKEEVLAQDEALQLIATAAEGSVRDALSLLDQAIARAHGGTIEPAQVRAMIGATDRTSTFRLIRHMLSGNAAAALAQVGELYQVGVDPVMLVQDVLGVTNDITRIKVLGAGAQDPLASEHERSETLALSLELSMPVLTRLWQMLLKGVGEVKIAPSPLSALEMLVVRVGYAAELPTLAEAMRAAPHAPARATAVVPSLAPTAPKTSINSFEEAVALFEKKREPLLHAQLMNEARLISFAQGNITLQLPQSLGREFTQRIATYLSEWTGLAWNITREEGAGAASLQEQANSRKETRVKEAAEHPLVSSVLEQFPGAKIMSVG